MNTIATEAGRTMHDALSADSSTRAGSELFQSYLREKLPLVEQALADAGASSLGADAAGLGATLAAPEADLTRYLYNPLARFTASGGKRVRPVLALLGAEAVGGAPELALSCGVAIELFQSAALIHDDIADESELRRGEPCLYRTEGVGLATNVGDLALTRVFEVVMADEALPAERRLRVLAELARMERHTLEGQALDLGWVRDARWDVTSENYFYMIDAKTAWYSAACPLMIGALAAGGSEDAAAGLFEVGRMAGIAFQIQDDLLNLVGDAAAQGKDFRSDITEGKRTLAVVWALEHLEAEPRAELVRLLEAHTSDPSELARAVELIEQGGGIETCRTVAQERADKAAERAAELAENTLITPETADLLCSMATFFTHRRA